MEASEIWISESAESVRIYLGKKEIILSVAESIFTGEINGRNLKVDLSDDWRFPVHHGEETYALIHTVPDGLLTEYLLSNGTSYTLKTSAWVASNLMVTCLMQGTPLFELRHARLGEFYRYAHLRRHFLTSEKFSGKLLEGFDPGRDLPFLLHAMKFSSYGRADECRHSVHGLRGR